MDGRMREYRITRWVGRLLAVLSLVATCGAHAADEYILPIPAWCPAYRYGGFYETLGLVRDTTYPTDFEAAQFTAYLYSTVSITTTPSSFSDDIETMTITSCNGQGGCSICNTWPNQGRTNCYGNAYVYGLVEHCPSCPPSYTYNAHMNACVRTAKLTITLYGGTEVEPTNGSDKKFLPIIATVRQSNGQSPTNPVTVEVSIKVEDQKSGGHEHGDSNRPRGGIANVETCTSDAKCWTSPQPTDVNGQVVFNFNAPEASGTHTISATCDGCSNTATKPVNVKVDGLKPIPAVPLFYALNETNGDVIGAQTGWHTDNHNLTPAAAQKLMVIALLYRTLPQFKVVVDKKTGKKDFPPVLHINDASLPWGGRLDVEAEWNAPHKEHRRGTVVDIRANSKPGAIPSANFDSFIQLAKLHKVHAKPHSEGQTNQHFHVRLLNRSE